MVSHKISDIFPRSFFSLYWFWKLNEITILLEKKSVFEEYNLINFINIIKSRCNVLDESSRFAFNFMILINYRINDCGN